METRRRSTSEHRKAATEKRRFSLRNDLTGKQKRIIAVILAVLLLFGATYGRSIMKLKAENRALKKQQEELTAEKDAKTKELKNAHSRDYIEEQARKQLRLLNKDEILFVFDDEKDEGKTDGSN